MNRGFILILGQNFEYFAPVRCSRTSEKNFSTRHFRGAEICRGPHNKFGQDITASPSKHIRAFFGAANGGVRAPFDGAGLSQQLQRNKTKVNPPWYFQVLCAYRVTSCHCGQMCWSEVGSVGHSLPLCAKCSNTSMCSGGFLQAAAGIYRPQSFGQPHFCCANSCGRQRSAVICASGSIFTEFSSVAGNFKQITYPHLLDHYGCQKLAFLAFSACSSV